MDWYCLRDPVYDTVMEFKGKPLYVSEPSVLEILLEENDNKVEGRLLPILEEHKTWNLGIPKEKGLYVFFFRRVFREGIHAIFGGVHCSYVLSYFNGETFSNISRGLLNTGLFLGWQKIEEFSGRYL